VAESLVPYVCPNYRVVLRVKNMMFANSEIFRIKSQKKKTSDGEKGEDNISRRAAKEGRPSSLRRASEKS